MTDIVFAIDGSGPFFNSTYARDMKGSFVQRIYEGARGAANATKFYYRGPSMFAIGHQSGWIGATSLYDYLKSFLSASNHESINVYICGYSRGGMVALYVANRIVTFNRMHGLYSSTSNALKRTFGFSGAEPAPIVIKSVVLFDAVDSDILMSGPSTNSLPRGVKKAAHFVCNTATSTSRAMFNRITVGDPEGVMEGPYKYTATHSCLGGLPGAGDMYTGSSSSTVVSAGAAKALQTPVNPLAPGQTIVNAGANFAVGSAQEAWKALNSSNITVAQDKAEFITLERDVGKKLTEHGWPLNSF
jgi:hypothetical protein